PYLKSSRQVASDYVPIANTGTIIRDMVFDDVGANFNGNINIAQSQINDVINGTGRRVTTEAAASSFSMITGGTPYPDSNNDGIADTWASLHGISSADQVKAEYEIDGKTIINDA